jgi:hypothetical protein
VWETNSQTGIIPADARLLRVEMTGIGGNIYPSGFTAHPSPDSAAVPFVAPYGETPSGFRVFDDGLLTLAGAPINTECLDRTLHNTRAVVRDRQQAVFSFVQDDGTAQNPRFSAPPASTISTGLSALLGCVQCFIPHNGETWIDVRSLGTVSAYSSTDRIRVTSSHAAGAYDDTTLLDASTTFDTARLRVVGPNPIIEVYGIATTGNTVSPFAVVGLWRPGDGA